MTIDKSYNQITPEEANKLDKFLAKSRAKFDSETKRFVSAFRAAQKPGPVFKLKKG